MQVMFTKVGDRRYAIAVDRDHGPALLPRSGPGYDDLMPHDLAHYVVEEHYGIALGVWGQLAAGGGGIFYPAPEDNTVRTKRRVARIGAVGRSDMARSEQLVVVTVAAWERRIGRVKHQTGTSSIDIAPDELARAVARMEEVAGTWAGLADGRSLRFTWPRRLTLDDAGTRRGRRRAA